MYKYTAKYIDYDGNERTEDLYFNLSRAELAEMELSVNGGMQNFLQKIVKEQDSAKLVKYFKEILLRSYGEKSLDGKRFIKNDELTESFVQTEAYSDLFIRLASDAEFASEFINGIIPKQPEDHQKPQVALVNFSKIE